MGEDLRKEIAMAILFVLSLGLAIKIIGLWYVGFFEGIGGS